MNIAVNIIETPPQTVLAQDIEFEQAKINMQQRMLNQAREVAEEYNIGLRTRAIVGRSVSGSVLEILHDEEADQILMGWQGTRKIRKPEGFLQA